MEKKKVPEAVYEELKMLALLREICVLQYRTLNGGVAIIEIKIQDVFEDEEGQYLVAENGLTLQLHHLIAINGKPLKYFC